MPTPPREPEIEFLGKVVRLLLLAFRAATVGAALVALGYGLIHMADPPRDMSAGTGEIGAPLPIAPYFVWLCIGIPPLLPIRWLFGRGRWPMLVVGAALWCGPMGLEGDHEYGWLIRFFASLVAVSVLLVWKTIFALTQRTDVPDRAGGG
jgi:hypothetical protein